MTAGIAIPMVALHFGQFCALATNYNEEAVKVYLANHTFVPSRAASRAVSRANSFRDNKSPPLSPALSPNMSRSLDPLSGKMSPTAASDALALKRKLSLDANKGPNFSSVKALTAESFQLPTEEIGVSPTVATADAKDPVNDDSATKITPNDEVPVNQVGREASLSYDEAGIAGTWTDSFGAYDLEKILEGALEDESEHRPERSVSVSYEPYQESNRASSRDSIVIPSTSPPLLIRGSVKSDNTRVVQYFVMQELWWAELIIVIIFVVATALVVVLPTVLNDHSYIFLTYTAGKTYDYYFYY